jgi:hypothetical protein
MAQQGQPQNSAVMQQQAVVDKLAGEYKEKPSAELLAELKRKTDLLLYLKNVAKGNLPERARAAANTARLATIDRAIKQTSK